MSTPLVFAVNKGYFEAVELLLAVWSDLSISAPFILIKKDILFNFHGHFEIEKLLKSPVKPLMGLPLSVV